jgi:hypothetical protein
LSLKFASIARKSVYRNLCNKLEDRFRKIQVRFTTTRWQTPNLLVNYDPGEDMQGTQQPTLLR